MTILSKLNLSDKTKAAMLASPQTFTMLFGRLLMRWTAPNIGIEVRNFDAARQAVNGASMDIKRSFGLPQ